MTNDAELVAVRANIFADAHGYIADWQTFPWHRDDEGRIQAHKAHSSQALAIDVFGAIAMSKWRDAILGRIADVIGLPNEGPWDVKLEWTDPDRLLGERRATQVDAIAFSARAAILFECKFTEPGGGCSQPNKLSSGRHKGKRQCSGSYEVQVNPASGVEARCALTGKGIRYWDHIPQVFGLDAGEDYRPCPFSGDAFQWMRNSVLAARLSSSRGIATRVVATFADAPGLPAADKIRVGGLGHAPADPSFAIRPLSYQQICQIIAETLDDPKYPLIDWVDRKISSSVAPVSKGS